MAAQHEPQVPSEAWKAKAAQVRATVDLTDRVARCMYACDGQSPSGWQLPFFEYRSDRDHDSFYDGCKGWD